MWGEWWLLKEKSWKKLHLYMPTFVHGFDLKNRPYVIVQNHVSKSYTCCHVHTCYWVLQDKLYEYSTIIVLRGLYIYIVSKYSTLVESVGLNPNAICTHTTILRYRHWSIRFNFSFTTRTKICRHYSWTRNIVELPATTADTDNKSSRIHKIVLRASSSSLLLINSLKSFNR